MNLWTTTLLVGLAVWGIEAPKFESVPASEPPSQLKSIPRPDVAPLIGKWEDNLLGCGTCRYYIVSTSSAPYFPPYSTHTFGTLALGTRDGSHFLSSDEPAHQEVVEESWEDADSPALEDGADFELIYASRFNCEGDGNGCHGNYAPGSCHEYHSTACSGISLAPEKVMRLLVEVTRDNRVAELTAIIRSSRAEIQGASLYLRDCSDRVSAVLPLPADLVQPAVRLLATRS